MKSGERLKLEVTEGRAAMAGEKAIPKRQRGRIGRPSAEEAASLEERILSATWDLLLAKGAGELSVERIARAAAVSKKTIYTRFHDRSDLLMRLLQRKLELEEDGLHEDVHVEDFRAAFCSVGRRILTFLISPERQAIAASPRRALTSAKKSGSGFTRYSGPSASVRSPTEVSSAT